MQETHKYQSTKDGLVECYLVSRKKPSIFLASRAFFTIFTNKKFGNEEKGEVLIFVCNFL